MSGSYDILQGMYLMGKAKKPCLGGIAGLRFSIHLFHCRDECHAHGRNEKGDCQGDHHNKRAQNLC